MNFMVAECFVYYRSNIVRYYVDIKSINVGMSSNN